MLKHLQDRVTLNNGLEMPGFGFGVFQVENETVIEPVKNAIELGYRAIDTAAIYGNEEGVGKGIKLGLEATGLKREDLFITSKVWNGGLDYAGTIKAYEESLEKLGLEYLDLYLIHWPGKAGYKEVWRALEDLYVDGKMKSIGVSNFQVSHLEDLLNESRITPVVNQIELHPRLTQEKLREFGKNHHILIEAWSPLMQGQLLDNQQIQAIAEKHGKTSAQVILRWDIQSGIITIPKSVKRERIQSNADVFDFTLSEEEMKQLNDLNTNTRVGPNPDEFDF